VQVTDENTIQRNTAETKSVDTFNSDILVTTWIKMKTEKITLLKQLY
jgi:hypothetical protein